MTAHLHSKVVPGCFRCELSADEVEVQESQWDPMPQPGTGPEYHADLAAWLERHQPKETA